MPHVEVRDGAGNLIKTYEIYVQGYGTLVTDEHVFELAKRNAIEDELVTEAEADGLTFELTD